MPCVRRPVIVSADLTAIEGSRGAHYIVALQDHASVLFRADAVALDAVAVRFANMEARILEAEAWA